MCAGKMATTNGVNLRGSGNMLGKACGIERT